MVKTGLAAGPLNCLVTVQVRTNPASGAQDSFGDVQDDFADSFEEWAAFQQLGSREFWVAHRLNAETTARFVMRYRPDITATLNQITYDGRTWEVLGVTDPDGRKIRLHVEVSEIL